MNKFEKIVFLSGITISILAGVMNLFIQNWTMGVTQLSLAWFMFLYYKNRTK